MCVIAHNERSVGCASLCPLIPIIPLCGVLLHLIKGLNNIQYLILLYFCVWPHISRDELDVRSTFLFFFAIICSAHTHPYTRPKLDEHPTSQLKPEYKYFKIEIQLVTKRFFLKKKRENNLKFDICVDADIQFRRINNI